MEQRRARWRGCDGWSQLGGGGLGMRGMVSGPEGCREGLARP